MQMNSGDEAGVGPKNFSAWMEEESFESTDSSLTKKSSVPELLNHLPYVNYKGNKVQNGL